MCCRLFPCRRPVSPQVQAAAAGSAPLRLAAAAARAVSAAAVAAPDASRDTSGALASLSSSSSSFPLSFLLARAAASLALRGCAAAAARCWRALVSAQAPLTGLLQAADAVTLAADRVGAIAFMHDFLVHAVLSVQAGQRVPLWVETPEAEEEQG